VHFTIDSFFWTAVLAAIIITLVSLGAGWFTGTRR
jgi:putative membrane protein